MPIEIVLCQPEIAQNTGNVARTCAAIGARLHLIHPLGFYMTDRHLKRAGLDYWPLVQVMEHTSLTAFQEQFPQCGLWLFSGAGKWRYDKVPCQAGDALVFGSESRGLPPALLAAHVDQTVRIPMVPGARALNVANAVAIAAYATTARLQPPWY